LRFISHCINYINVRYIIDYIKPIIHKESGVVFRAESCLIERHYRDGIRTIMQNFGIRSASVIRRHKLTRQGIINLYCYNLWLLIKGFRKGIAVLICTLLPPYGRGTLNDKRVSLRYEADWTRLPRFVVRLHAHVQKTLCTHMHAII